MQPNLFKGYKIIQTEIKALLLDKGFKPYKSATLYRITDNNILQFINFQKGQGRLSDQMTINVVLQGLFSPTCSFGTLMPGGRIGDFLQSHADKWWFCDTEQSTSKSVSEIKEAISGYLLPFFSRASSAEAICALLDSNEFSFIWQNPYAFIDKGFYYLQAKRYGQAIDTFQSKQPSKVPKFKTIQKLVAQNKADEIEQILDINIMHAKLRLGI